MNRHLREVLNHSHRIEENLRASRERQQRKVEEYQRYRERILAEERKRSAQQKEKTTRDTMEIEHKEQEHRDLTLEDLKVGDVFYFEAIASKQPRIVTQIRGVTADTHNGTIVESFFNLDTNTFHQPFPSEQQRKVVKLKTKLVVYKTP